jgi:predicted short-subunit dehydrogenase-like oxidoreductase (DUF2520 family)
MFTKIAIVGTGNIGSWLFQTLQNQTHLIVVSISGRNIETLPQDFDLYIFALKDDVYEIVLQQVPFRMPHAVHTSGSISMNILAPYAKKIGVLYPYQTIRQKPESRMQNAENKIPICIEASDSAFETALFQWVNSIFIPVYKVNEKQRFAMHLAAVFANNFTNAMYGIAYNIFKENDLDWSLIFPLLENTLEKAKQNAPQFVQTGPAVRGDAAIMEKHCKTLKTEDLKLLYKLLSKIIQQKT